PPDPFPRGGIPVYAGVSHSGADGDFVLQPLPRMRPALRVWPSFPFSSPPHRDFVPACFAACRGLRLAKCYAVASFSLDFASVVVLKGTILDRAARCICLSRHDGVGNLGD